MGEKSGALAEAVRIDARLRGSGQAPGCSRGHGQAYGEDHQVEFLIPDLGPVDAVPEYHVPACPAAPRVSKPLPICSGRRVWPWHDRRIARTPCRRRGYRCGGLLPRSQGGAPWRGSPASSRTCSRPRSSKNSRASRPVTRRTGSRQSVGDRAVGGTEQITAIGARGADHPFELEAGDDVREPVVPVKALRRPDRTVRTPAPGSGFPPQGSPSSLAGENRWPCPYRWARRSGIPSC